MSSSTRKPVVYIISAPSGSGKSTLVGKLLKLIGDLDFSISYTTRPPLILTRASALRRTVRSRPRVGTHNGAREGRCRSYRGVV